MPGKKESRRARTTPVNTWRRRSRTVELLTTNETMKTFVERYILSAIHQTIPVSVDGSYGSRTKPQPVESPVPEYWKDNYLNPDLAAKLMVWACERISGLWMLVHEEIQLAFLAFFHLFPQIRGFILVTVSPLLS